MQNYWLTTHWPHPLDGSRPWYLYLRPGDRAATREVTSGDAVLFYETKGPAPKGLCDPRPSGRGGVIAIAEVGGGWRKKKPWNQADQWTLEAVCVFHKDEGFIARKELCEIMGWKPTYKMFGIGRGSGILKISPEQFKAASWKFFSRHR